jgi:hypothetical protein
MLIAHETGYRYIIFKNLREDVYPGGIMNGDNQKGKEEKGKVRKTTKVLFKVAERRP